MRSATRPGERPQHLVRRTRTHPCSERGSVALWVAVMAAAVLLTLVLVVDGGAKVRAGSRADIAAAEAARAAVLAVGPRGSGSGMDARLAVAAARAYLARAGVKGSVVILGPGTVQVRVQATDTGPISGHTFTMTRTAVAELLIGVENGVRP